MPGDGDRAVLATYAADRRRAHGLASTDRIVRRYRARSPAESEQIELGSSRKTADAHIHESDVLNDATCLMRIRRPYRTRAMDKRARVELAPFQSLSAVRGERTDADVA